MKAEPTRRTLFSRLLSTRASRQGKHGVKGQEEYLTQVMAFLLETDHRLARAWLQDWFGIGGAQDIKIAAEYSKDSAPYSDLPDSTIDIRVRCRDGHDQQHLIYVENKVEAKLNVYKDGDGVIDQVEKYTELLERVCEASEDGLQGHLIVCGLRPQKPRSDQLTPHVRWHQPKYWWDFTELVRDHVDAPSGAAWVQDEYLAFCAEQGLMPLEALRPETVTAEQARRLLGLAALDARASSISTTCTETEQHSWEATVYFTPSRSRVAARPRYWVSMSQKKGKPVETRAYWVNVCDVGDPIGDGWWSLGLDAQRIALKNAIEGIAQQKGYMESALELHSGDAAAWAKAITERMWDRPDVWVAATGYEIRIQGAGWPAGMAIKITQSDTHRSELVLIVPREAAWLDGVLERHLGEPQRKTATYRCYRPSSGQPDSIIQLVEELNQTESSA